MKFQSQYVAHQGIVFAFFPLSFSFFLYFLHLILSSCNPFFFHSHFFIPLFFLLLSPNSPPPPPPPPIYCLRGEGNPGEATPSVVRLGLKFMHLCEGNLPESQKIGTNLLGFLCESTKFGFHKHVFLSPSKV